MDSSLALIKDTISSAPEILSTLSLASVADILIVAVLIYLVLIFIKQTKSYFVLHSLLVLLALNFISNIFSFRLTKLILEPLLTGIVIISAVVFQKEIRRFFRFVTAGQGFVFSFKAPATPESIEVIADTVFEMAEKKIGGIIIFPGETSIDDIVDGGFILDGKISRPLLLSIFDSNSPGHDGAVLIENNKIHKFGLHLPLAEDFKEAKRVGTRHRAAAGVTERADAIALVVSEERGVVSIAENGSLRSIDDRDGLLSILEDFSEDVKEGEPITYPFWHYLIFRNVEIKAMSILLAMILWMFLLF